MLQDLVTGELWGGRQHGSHGGVSNGTPLRWRDTRAGLRMRGPEKQKLWEVRVEGEMYSGDLARGMMGPGWPNGRSFSPAVPGAASPRSGCRQGSSS